MKTLAGGSGIKRQKKTSMTRKVTPNHTGFNSEK